MIEAHHDSVSILKEPYFREVEEELGLAIDYQERDAGISIYNEPFLTNFPSLVLDGR